MDKLGESGGEAVRLENRFYDKICIDKLVYPALFQIEKQGTKCTKVQFTKRTKVMDFQVTMVR